LFQSRVLQRDRGSGETCSRREEEQCRGRALYNLADEYVEYLIRGRLSFMRFLGLGLEDAVPDASTVWLFREADHIRVDRKHKLIRRYAETGASVHDSQKLDEVLDKSNTSNEVWADSAYRSVETEARLKEKGYKRRIHGRGARNHALSRRQQSAKHHAHEGARSH
jgi:IS5 family transposase